MFIYYLSHSKCLKIHDPNMHLIIPPSNQTSNPRILRILLSENLSFSFSSASPAFFADPTRAISRRSPPRHLQFTHSHSPLIISSLSNPHFHSRNANPPFFLPEPQKIILFFNRTSNSSISRSMHPSVARSLAWYMELFSSATHQAMSFHAIERILSYNKT